MKVLPLVLREGLRSELFTLTRAQCGLKDTVTQFTLRGAKHSRNEGSITDPAPLGTIARVILNLNCKETYCVVRTGVEEYLQKKSAKSAGKKITLPALHPEGGVHLEDGQALFLPLPACNTTMFLVSKAPRGAVRRDGKLVPYLRARNYERLMIVIDFAFQPEREEVEEATKLFSNKDSGFKPNL